MHSCTRCATLSLGVVSVTKLQLRAHQMYVFPSVPSLTSPRLSLACPQTVKAIEKSLDSVTAAKECVHLGVKFAAIPSRNINPNSRFVGAKIARDMSMRLLIRKLNIHVSAGN